MTAAATTARSPLPGAATSRAVIDLGAIAHNGSLLAQAAGVPWMAVVKADAYGHGLGPVALTALSAGASWLGVAQLAEALTLRSLLDEAGVPRPAGEPSGRAPRVLTWLLPVMDPARAAAQDSPRPLTWTCRSPVCPSSMPCWPRSGRRGYRRASTSRSTPACRVAAPWRRTCRPWPPR